MASKALSSPFIRHIAKRGYAQAAPAFKEPKILSSVLSNKTFIAALDNGSPVTRVTIAFKAGTRYEPSTEAGLTHILRASAGLSTSNANGFIIARKLAQVGASVTASGDREFIYYTLETTQEQLSEALECLNNLVSCQEFRPWELDDNAPRLKYDIAALPPQMRAVDLLHKAAYRRGLGYSLFISPRRMGSISSESLQHFVASALTPSRCAITVVGDSLERAQVIAQNLKLQSCGDIATEPSRYFSGEARKEMGGDLAHVALAVEGAAAGTPQAVALAIAAKALGNGPVTKWGVDNSPLGKAIGNVGPFAAAGFNVSYSDSGLYGVVLSVAKDEASAAVKSAANVMRKELSSANIKAGKNQLKLQVLSDTDVGSSFTESLAAQGLYTGIVKNTSDLIKEIDQISDSQVNQVLSSATQSKFSLGAVGNLAFVPYVDEL